MGMSDIRRIQYDEDGERLLKTFRGPIYKIT